MCLCAVVFCFSLSFAVVSFCFAMWNITLYPDFVCLMIKKREGIGFCVKFILPFMLDLKSNEWNIYSVFIMIIWTKVCGLEHSKLAFYGNVYPTCATSTKSLFGHANNINIFFVDESDGLTISFVSIGLIDQRNFNRIWIYFHCPNASKK